MRTRLSALLALTTFLVPLILSASGFPDVPASHPFATAINGLVNAGVITGNPDGTFKPTDPVNRAAMLKMLYLAKKRDIGVAKNCFPDVAAGSWYEPFVCDAVQQGYVKGYVDGTFKPARPVSRAEALKMTIAVMGIPLTGGEDVSTRIRAYTDVARSAWYATYVATAMARGILPIAGQEGGMLQPDVPLERAEAAAYIWNALNGRAVSSSSESSSASTGAAASAASSVSSKNISAADVVDTSQILTMTFPITDAQRFRSKKPFSYRFHLVRPAVVDITARIREGQQGGITCTLFSMGDQGFSTEYYIGYVEGPTCQLHVSLRSGDYQLQLTPTMADTEYLVESSFGKGDGNDGFAEAVQLPIGQTRTGVLDANDLEDWYVFQIRKERGSHKFSVTSADHVRCIIYPAADVDIFGFEGPTCNTAYEYPVGTYYVGIGHAYPKTLKETYTVDLR